MAGGKFGKGKGRKKAGTQARSNELEGERTKEAWGTLAEAGAGAGKSNDLAGLMEKGSGRIRQRQGQGKERDSGSIK